MQSCLGYQIVFAIAKNPPKALLLNRQYIFSQSNQRIIKVLPLLHTHALARLLWVCALQLGWRHSSVPVWLVPLLHVTISVLWLLVAGVPLNQLSQRRLPLASQASAQVRRRIALPTHFIQSQPSSRSHPVFDWHHIWATALTCKQTKKSQSFTKVFSVGGDPGVLLTSFSGHQTSIPAFCWRRLPLITQVPMQWAVTSLMYVYTLTDWLNVKSTQTTHTHAHTKPTSTPQTWKTVIFKRKRGKISFKLLPWRVGCMFSWSQEDTEPGIFTLPTTVGRMCPTHPPADSHCPGLGRQKGPLYFWYWSLYVDIKTQHFLAFCLLLLLWPGLCSEGECFIFSLSQGKCMLS